MKYLVVRSPFSLKERGLSGSRCRQCKQQRRRAHYRPDKPPSKSVSPFLLSSSLRN